MVFWLCKQKAWICMPSEVSNVFSLSPQRHRHMDLCEFEVGKRYLVSDSVSKTTRKQKLNKTKQTMGIRWKQWIMLVWVQPSLLCYYLMKFTLYYSTIQSELLVYKQSWSQRPALKHSNHDVNRPSSMSSLRLLERCEVEEGTWMCWIEYANVSAFQEHLAVFLHIHWKHVGWQRGSHSTSTHLSYSHTTSLEKHPIRRKLIRSEQEIRCFPKPAPASPSHQCQGLLDFLWDGSVSTLLRSLPVCMILTGLSMAHVRPPHPQVTCECNPTYLWTTMSYFNVEKLDILVPSL